MKTTLMISLLFMGQTVNLDLAVTPVEHVTGMMYRKEWTAANQGMLFINDKPRAVSFWMENTYLPLSIMYIDSNYNIVETHRGNPLDKTTIPSKSANIQYILELNPEWESSVKANWPEFKGLMVDALKKKEKEIERLRRPL